MTTSQYIVNFQQGDTISIAPNPSSAKTISYIRSQQHLGVVAMTKELIDNAFDANADHVVITFDSGAITISDNGRGCNDLHRMVAIGYGQSYQSTSIGMHSIGGKEALIILGDFVTIESVHAGIKRRVSVDWKKLTEADTWNIPKPIEQATSDPCGTIIKISRTRKSVPSFTDLSRSLGDDYFPGITSGAVRITIKTPKTMPRPVIAPGHPELEHREDCAFDLGDGRTGKFAAGILSNPKDGRCFQGITLATKNRVIQRRLRYGLGDTPSASICIYVQLCGDRRAWGLSKNKDSISEQSERILAQEIARRFHHMIERAKSQKNNVFVDGINNVLKKLPSQCETIQRRLKARRKSPQNHPGAIIPTGDGPRHDYARKVQPGETLIGGLSKAEVKEQTGVEIVLVDRKEDDPIFSMDGPYIIEINTASTIYKTVGPNSPYWGILPPLYAVAHNEICGKPGWFKFKSVDPNSDASRFDIILSMVLQSYLELSDKDGA